MFGWLKNRGRDAPDVAGETTVADRPAVPHVEALARKAEGDAFALAGNPGEAIRCYRSSIELDPGQAEVYRDLALLLVRGGDAIGAGAVLDQGLALHPGVVDLHAFAGNVHLHRQQFEAAVAAFDRALALHPEFPEVFYNRGMALQGLGRLDDAVASHDGALRTRPAYLAPLIAKGELLRLLDQPEAALATYETALAIETESASLLLSRANMLLVLGRAPEALAGFDAALRRDPRLAAALHNRGAALRDLGRDDEAIDSYDRALAIDPAMTQALIDKGTALRGLARPAEALASYRLALTLAPDLPDVLNNCGLALHELKRFDEALAMYDRALSARPGFAEALNNRALTLQDLKRHDEALADYDRALQINGELAEAHANRANVLQVFERHEEALTGYDRALRIKPELESTYLNQSLSQLITGRLPLGWQKYEWRYPGRLKGEPMRPFDEPVWNGSQPLHGKTVLLYAEQGLGDTIQFCRYAADVAELGAKVLLEVQTPLKNLLAKVKGAAQVLGRGEPPPRFDLHAPLLSLPLAFGTSLQTIPHPGTYIDIEADRPERVDAWRGRLGPATKPRVGLVWSGNADHKNDAQRSIPLSLFARLTTAAEAEFVSLQPEVRASDELALAAHPQIASYRADLTDFVETAALIAQLDLVIAVDTSVAHLAGALGKPVWLLLPTNPDWRWLLDRDDSPWYDEFRLFRQRRRGDWDDVIERVETALQGLVANWRGAGATSR